MDERTPKSREKILATGLDLMSEVGVSGITLGALAGEVGMSKSGLFAHFRSKEAVQLALLDEMARVADAVVVAPAMAAPLGLARLTALVDLWLGWTRRAGLRGGCPVAAGLFELDDLDGEIRAKVLGMEGRWRALLTELVGEAVVLCDLAPGLDTDQFVFELCGLYLSHHVSARFLADPAADRRAATAFEALLHRARAPQAA